MMLGTLAAAGSASAGLVARWDFNNYDSANPSSTNILAATVGDAGYACYYNGRGSALVSGGTLGQMYVACADSTDTNAQSAFNALGGGNYALAIPSKSHVALPIPNAVKNHPWTIKIRCWIPATGWHCLFNRSNTTDGDLFITPARSGRTTNGIGGNVFGNNNNYKTAIGIGSWQTVTVSAGPTRHDVFLNESTEALYGNNGNNLNFFGAETLTTYNGKTCLLLSADDDAEDGLMYVDYVELFDDASAYEGKAPQYTKDGLTGEWTFPSGDPLKATVGLNLVKNTRTGGANFTEVPNAVIKGDSAMRVGQNNSLLCYHGLPAGSSYTIVTDLRVPDTSNKTQSWHGFFKSTGLNDALLFFLRNGSTGAYNIRITGTATIGTVIPLGEWRRYTIAYNAGNGYTTIYVNGTQVYNYNKHNAAWKPVKGGYFLLLGDEDGEDYDTDISYAAVYDRALSAAEIQELHSRPLAQQADGAFIPTVAPTGLWSGDGTAGGLTATLGAALEPTTDGGYTWMRSSASAAVTYVADLTLPATQTDGGVLVKNASNVASGIYGTSSTYNGSFTTTTVPSNFKDNTQINTWGYWSESTLDRTSPHRLAVTWAANGRVHYYVDGRLWGQIFPLSANTAAKPSATMSFFNGLGASVTRLAAYDVALTPDEVASLGGPGTAATGNAPVVTVTSSTVPAEVKSMVDSVSFTISATHPDGERIAYAVDWGDGEGTSTGALVAPGTQQTFTHIYKNAGTYTPTFKAISQNGVVGTVAGTSVTVIVNQFAASDVLLTWPWQQNVYTNRFTIMCEGVKDANDINKWEGLEVQWGENYANRTTMTRVESNGGTWLYKAHITVEGMDGQTIPYRLGYFGLPLTFADAAQDTAGEVKLWSQTAGESFKVAIWGDNQQGARQYDWDSDKYAYVRALFSHMVAQGVDFGISSGDMASSANYESQIKPGILQATDGILGRTRPYYVAWGNHDISYRNNQPYFETGSIDDPNYGTSEDGAYYLYRGNVLFIFIHQSAYNATTATWLSNLLATDRAKAASFRVMIQHYPFWLECWSGNNNTALLAAAKAGGVDIVFSGHMHGYERYLKDGIVQLTNGGAGYLDHVETVTTFYGSDIFIGGHKNVPYLWARQASPSVNNVLGAAEPVRMGCIQSYGELRFENNKLHYLAHGFNADGSYIGVFDDFTLTSKTCDGEGAVATQVTPCAEAATFAEFTTKPVTNAKWAEYKTAVGEAFSYPEGKGDSPVVNVSRTEIEKFLVWLNGETGDYRLPTIAELETAFGGELRREVAEWSSSVDPNTGWCRILGSPAKALEGTWTRAEDMPSIATPGCHADYLGFRLATGAAPAQPAYAWDAPLAALAQIAEPARAYKWENGELVDISETFYAPTGAQVYDVPVILTDSDAILRENQDPLTFNAGFTTPNANSFYASGDLYVKGEVKGGVCGNQWQWRMGTTNGTFTVDGVTYRGQGITFRSGDMTLRVKGANDFSGAMYVFNNETQHPTNVVTAVADEAASIKFASVRNLGTFPYRVGENVTMKVAEEFRVVNSTWLWVDGTLDIGAFNVQNNSDPGIYGAGTLKLGYYGSCVNSWPYFGVSNIVVTTKRFWRANSPSTKSYNGILLNGDEIHISSTCDWEIPSKDQFGYNTFFLSNNREHRVKVVLEGEHNLDFAPAYTAGSLSGSAFTNPWDLEQRGTGTVTITTPVKGNVTVSDGIAKIAKHPASGASAVATGNGKWQINDTLSLSKGQHITGNFVEGGTVALALGATPANGLYEFIGNGGAAVESFTVTHDVTATATVLQSEGQVAVLVGEFAKTAVWTGAGNRANPLDPANWKVSSNGEVVAGAVPDSATTIIVSGETSLNVPSGSSLEYAALLLTGRVTLSADCDWRGFGEVALSESLVLDLCGHRLSLPSFTMAAATITDSTTDAEHPGELHLDLAEGVTLTNNQVAFTGNFKLVKEGLGTYMSAKGGQSYSGGNLIAAGKFATNLSSGGAPGSAPLGLNTGSHRCVTTVASGAVLDLGTALTGWGYHGMVLDGGTLSGCTTQPNFALSLTADSTIDSSASNADFGSTNLGGINPILNGHTLTLKVTSAKTLFISGSTGPGTIHTTPQGGWTRFIGAVTPSEVAQRISLNHEMAMNFAAAVDVQDYYAQYDAGYMAGTATMRVFGTFTPVGNSFYGCVLQDGAALDLSTRDGTWSTTRANTGDSLSGNGTVTFADNATITLKFGDRRFRSWTKVVGWTAAPANVDTLTFQFEAKRKRIKLEVRDDGVWMLEIPMMIIVR